MLCSPPVIYQITMKIAHCAQVAALCSVALLLVQVWPEILNFATSIQKLIAITVAECSIVFAFAVTYLWRIHHEALPDAQMYLQSALYTAPDSRIRCAVAIVTFWISNLLLAILLLSMPLHCSAMLNLHVHAENSCVPDMAC